MTIAHAESYLARLREESAAAKEDAETKPEAAIAYWTRFGVLPLGQCDSTDPLYDPGRVAGWWDFGSLVRCEYRRLRAIAEKP